MSRLSLYLTICSLLWAAGCWAAASGPSQVDPAALKNWQDMRFGMFIHWGPVSLTGEEIGWSRGQETPIEQYDALYKQFNPEQFNAEDWVKVARETGMKYIVLTTKHHDGFCLWDTKQTDYNIMNSPFKRDVVAELAAACKKQGIAFGTYYSTCDWHHRDFPRTSPGGQVKRDVHNLDRYTEYLKAQVKELLTGYGPLVTIWFDVPQEFDAVRGQGVIDFVRALQPDLVVNNRTGAKGDYSTPEQRIGSFDRQRPWETCMTICRQWAWKPDDLMKSREECLRALIYTIGGDGNLLFNVGPMPDGRIELRQVERLKEMGQWVRQHEEGIYGTRGGPFKPGSWGASTCKGKAIYLYVLQWPDGQPLQLPAISPAITEAKTLCGGPVQYRQSAEAVEVDVAPDKRCPFVTVIKLTVEGEAFSIPPCAVSVSGSAAYGKSATASNTFKNDTDYGPDKALDDDAETRWATDGGVRSAWLAVDLGEEVTVDSAMIDERGWDRVQKFELQYQAGDEWQTVCAGTTIGAQKRLSFAPTKARHFRLNILDATDGPTIWEFQLFKLKK